MSHLHKSQDTDRGDDHVIPQLYTHNSDGSDPTASPPATWLDELYYWGLIAALTCAFTGLLALTAGYVISR